jgi:drug/metabolite transporter (DMT)-like permease
VTTHAKLPLAYQPATHQRGKLGDVLLLLFGVFTCSTAVLFIKACQTNPIVLAGVRTAIATVALAPIVAFQLMSQVRRRRSLEPLDAISPRQLLRSLPGAVLLAAHMISWNFGARTTTVANATLIVNLTAVALPFYMWFIYREKINLGEVIGITMALGGVFVLTAKGLSIGDDTVWGDLVCFASMLVFAGYIAAGRKLQKPGGLWLYVVPLYAMTSLICFATAAVYGGLSGKIELAPMTAREILLLLGLGLIPTVMGHSIFNHAIKVLRGSTVSSMNLLQVVFAAVMAYVLWGERPSLRLLLTAAFIVAGVIIVIRSAPPPVTPAVEPET